LGRLYLIILLVCLSLLSCESYPESDFYEVNGIVSINARSVPDQNNWINKPYYTSVSKVSYEDSLSVAGRLTFPFFIRRPGSYSIWTLSKKVSDEHEENNITFRVFDKQQFLLADFRLQLNDTHALEWLNRDSRTGEEIRVIFTEPGHYSITFESGGREGYVIDKLYLNLNDDRAPEGFAMPETNDFRIDPVLTKRDQRVVIPPGWAFGLIASNSGSGENSNQILDQLSSLNISPDAVVYTAGSGFPLRENGVYRGMMLYEENNQEVNHGNVLDNKYWDLAERFTTGGYHFAKLWPGAGYSVIKETFNLFLKEGLKDHRRAFVISGLENSFMPEMKEYPVIWPSLADLDILGFIDDEMHIFGLKETIGMVANPAMSTYEIPFLLLNIGGYYRDISLMDEEEIIRWFQFLSFYTMMYLQSGDSDVSDVILSLSAECQNHVSNLLGHRSQLYPYLYSLAHLVRPTGVKPVRGSAEHPTQFWLGNSFLVAPVYLRGASERELFLPEGIWYDYWDGTRYQGGETITVDSPINMIPVFVKAGSIIPYNQPEDTNTRGNKDIYKVDVYGGDRGTFRLYEDDGVSTRYQSGEFSTTAFRYFEHEDYATFTIGRRVRGYIGQPDYREILLTFKYVDEPDFITVDDETLDADAWSYDKESRSIHLTWSQPYYQKTDFFIQF
jgi:hypothetical protein